eukprot:TRINITY_DN1418_c0_g1_i1.p1 TRINITY_DN1418_c0_g1~~TRINITY_DN1418_c0_g1_i1.p1  ORF type:complete len:437 (-),score=77.61 TRINITY_DN1418_c0_g1_i1:79-1353(-)
MLGEMIFDALPEVASCRILDYLSLQDKKNLRLVSTRFAEQVLILEPSLRYWTIFMCGKNTWPAWGVPKYLEGAENKGITSLRNFKLHFVLDDQKCSGSMTVLRQWKDKVVGLDICPVSTLHFILPNLQVLNLKNYTDYRNNSKMFNHLAASELIKSHSSTLQRLTVDSKFVHPSFKHVNLKVVGLQLDYLSCKLNLPHLFNFGRNVTKLHFDKEEKVVDCHLLQFPNLKQLRITGFSNILIAKVNPHKLTTLIIDSTAYHNFNDVDIPDTLPKLTTLICFRSYDSSDSVHKILSACSKTLKHLIVKASHYNRHEDQVVKFDNLESFLCNKWTNWVGNMVTSNKDSIKRLVVEVDGNFKGEVINWSLPQLKEKVFLYSEMNPLPRMLCNRVMRDDDNFKLAYKSFHDYVHMFLKACKVDHQLAKL